MQQQCRATPSLSEDDALTTTLSSISSWLELRRHTFYELRKKTYAQQRKAINEELFGNKQLITFEIQSYAFTQPAMRELRAHTDNWADARKATAPSGLLGRAGQEHIRTMASEMLERQAHWPFHLAGDSGACLFNHRAWISWRLLALLDMCLSSKVFQSACVCADLCRSVSVCVRRDSHLQCISKCMCVSP